jgi:hypothetical protein
MLRHVVELQPKDTIAPQLLAQIEKPAGEPALAPPADAPRPGDAKPAEGAPALTFPVEGTWTASPNEGTTITLKIDSKGGFSWVVTERGNDRTIEGDSTHGHGLLTLSSKTGGVMVGRTEWSDESHFTFRISGGPKDDPGLSFTKAAP